MPNRRTLKQKIAAIAKHPATPTAEPDSQLRYLKSDLTRTIGVTILAGVIQLAMKLYLSGIKL